MAVEKWLSDVGVMVAVLAAIGLPFYRYYLRLLDNADAAEGAPDRYLYQEFRMRMELGGKPVALYSLWLGRMLDKVDRFFGDHSGYPIPAAPSRWFGLGPEPVPLWTSSAFDRCLLLALFYPLTSVMLIWIITGAVGPAEGALLLPEGGEAWRRAMTLAPAIPMLVYAVLLRRGWFTFGWSMIGAFAAAGGCAVAGAVAGKGTGALAVAGLGAFVISFAFSISAAAVGVFAFTFSFYVAFAFAFVFSIADVVASPICAGFAIISTMGFGFLDNVSQRHRIRGWFQLVILLAFTLASLALPHWLSEPDKWKIVGPLLYFFGLLTLINAPFDWLSLGLTRGLLRKGLKEGGWAPVWLGCVDALLSVVVIFALVAAMVVATRVFNHMAGLGNEVLDLMGLLQGIRDNPGASQYWWVYVLVVSTQFPSLLNLMIGATALFRGIPWVRRWCLAGMPEQGNMPKASRELLAVVLAGQVVGGALLGVCAQIGLAIGLIVYGLPLLGVEMLSFAAWVAGLLPG